MAVKTISPITSACGHSEDRDLFSKGAEEAEAICGWEQRAGMPPLEGAEAASDWGRRARHATLAGAYDALVAAVEAPARLIRRACWWIDNRDTEPGDVAELVAAAQATSAVVCENEA